MRLPRKVMHVLNAAVGGAALSTLGLVKALQREGVESSAVCHDMGTREEREALRGALDGRVAFVPLC